MKSVTRTTIQMIIILTLLGSMFLIHTNSRSSILIKEAIYVGGAALALLVASLGMFVDGRIASARFSRLLAVSFILFILWMVFRYYSGIQSVNALKYIYSAIALAGIVVVMATTFTKGNRDTVLWVMVISTCVLSIYAILQSIGVIIFPWDAGLTQTARSSGTMGNANLLGSFSMAMLPVGAGFLLSRVSISKFRYISALCFTFLCTGAIIASKTRGSLIGLFAIIVLIPFIPFIRKNRKALVSLLLVFMVLIAGSVIILGSRMEELTDFETGSLQVRKLIWSGTLSMITGNPILGYGPGSFQIVFPEFRNPDYFLLGVSHNTLHAHCEYMEILVDSGIIGLLLWAAVAYSLFRIVYRKRESIIPYDEDKKTADRWLVIGIIGGITALLAEATVSVAFRWPPSALLLALFTGLLLASIPTEFTPLRGVRKYGSATLLLLAAILLGAVAMPGYMRSMKSGKELFVGKDIYLNRIMFEIRNATNAASEWRSTGNDEVAQRALYHLDNARQVADSSIAWCRKCVETNPDELGGWYALGSAYISTARMYQNVSPQITSILTMSGMTSVDREKADQYMRLGLAAYDSLTRRAPNYAEVHNNLALVWINLGYPDNALTSLRNAWDLHAHNRKSYREKIEILLPLTNSLDGVYLKFRMSMRAISKLLLDDFGIDTESIQFRVLMFDYGTTFLRYKESADSLNKELIGIVSDRYPGIDSVMKEYTDMQIQRIQEGLDLLDRFEEGDTSGVLRELSGIQQDELDILPLHRALRGYILVSEGDFESMRTICEILGVFSKADFNDVTAWPMEISGMIGELNNALLITGLDEKDEKLLYLTNESNMLRFDREIFELMIFIESSSNLQESTDEVTEKLEILWEHIGGPLYCYMRTQENVPVAGESSLFDDSYRGILELEAQDSLNAEMIKFEIQWLYVLFCSSYYGIPHYTAIQGERTISLMVDARNRLVDIIGENETQYQIGSMLNDLSDLTINRVSGEFTEYIEALKSDLIMGRINL